MFRAHYFKLFILLSLFSFFCHSSTDFYDVDYGSAKSLDGNLSSYSASDGVDATLSTIGGWYIDAKAKSSGEHDWGDIDGGTTPVFDGAKLSFYKKKAIGNYLLTSGFYSDFSRQSDSSEFIIDTIMRTRVYYKWFDYRIDVSDLVGERKNNKKERVVSSQARISLKQDYGLFSFQLAGRVYGDGSGLSERKSNSDIKLKFTPFTWLSIEHLLGVNGKSKLWGKTKLYANVLVYSNIKIDLEANQDQKGGRDAFFDVTYLF